MSAYRKAVSTPAVPCARVRFVLTQDKNRNPSVHDPFDENTVSKLRPERKQYGPNCTYYVVNLRVAGGFNQYISSFVLYWTASLPILSDNGFLYGFYVHKLQFVAVQF